MRRKKINPVNLVNPVCFLWRTSMGRGKLLFQCLSATLVFVMALDPTVAQNRKPVEARLRVAVVDQTGAAIRNARVTINNRRQTLTTGKLGEVNFSDLAPGKYQLQVAAEGFTPVAVENVNVRPGANNIEVKLEVANVQDEVTPGRNNPHPRTDPRPAFSSVLTEEQIAQLPDDP